MFKINNDLAVSRNVVAPLWVRAVDIGFSEKRQFNPVRGVQPRILLRGEFQGSGSRVCSKSFPSHRCVRMNRG